MGKKLGGVVCALAIAIHIEIKARENIIV